MSQAASQWAAFARDVAKTRRLWTLNDDGGFPAPLTSSGVRAQPFWSSLARVKRIIRVVPAYSGFRPHELSWDEFRDHWLPELAKEGMRIGVNWSGSRAIGYDIDPKEVRARVEYEVSKLSVCNDRQEYSNRERH
jgi:hypothetical protein